MTVKIKVKRCLTTEYVNLLLTQAERMNLDNPYAWAVGSMEAAFETMTRNNKTTKALRKCLKKKIEDLEKELARKY